MSDRATWLQVRAALAADPRAIVIVERRHIDPLPQPGWYPSVGIPFGQVGDYRYPLPSGPGLHARVFPDRYEIHLDRIDPSRDLVGHLAVDAPAVVIALGAGLGAGAARLMAGPRAMGPGLVVGALTGAVITWLVRRNFDVS